MYNRKFPSKIEEKQVLAFDSTPKQKKFEGGSAECWETLFLRKVTFQIRSHSDNVEVIFWLVGTPVNLKQIVELFVFVTSFPIRIHDNPSWKQYLCDRDSRAEYEAV